MLTIKDIYYLCQQNQAAHSESGEAVIIFYSRWGIEGYITLPGGILLQWGIIPKVNDSGVTYTWAALDLVRPFADVNWKLAYTYDFYNAENTTCAFRKDTITVNGAQIRIIKQCNIRWFAIGKA